MPPAREDSFERRAAAAPKAEPEWRRINGSLVMVNGDRALSRQWRLLMKPDHPLGDGPLCSAQPRYLTKG